MTKHSTSPASSNGAAALVVRLRGDEASIEWLLHLAHRLHKRRSAR